MLYILEGKKRSWRLFRHLRESFTDLRTSTSWGRVRSRFLVNRTLFILVSQWVILHYVMARPKSHSYVFCRFSPVFSLLHLALLHLCSFASRSLFDEWFRVTHLREGFVNLRTSPSFGGGGGHMLFLGTPPFFPPTCAQPNTTKKT